MFFNCSLVHPAVMMRHDVLFSQGYPTTFPSAEDYALWLLFLTQAPSDSTLNDPIRMANLPGAPVLYLRKHASNVSKSSRERQQSSTHLALLAALKRINTPV